MADGLAQRRWGLLGLLLAIGTSLVVAGHVDVGVPLTDLFQEGEYLATAANVAAPAGGHYPLMIHGLINYLPFTAAQAACGTSTAIACTRSLNGLLSALAMIAFACTIHRLLLRAPRLRLPAALGVCAFLLAYNGRAAVPIDLHQGAPAIRDLFLLLDVLLVVALLRDGAGRAGQVVAAACLGLTLPVALFWAYNRGVVCGVVFGLTVLCLLALRRWAAAAAGVLSALVGLALAFVLNPGLLEQHVFNVLYWSRNSGIWSFPITPQHLVTLLPFFVGSLAVAGVALLRAVARWRAGQGGEAGLLAVLSVIALLVLAQCIGRSDNIHLSYVFPYLGLVLAAWATAKPLPTGPVRRGATPGSVLAVAAAAVLMEFYSPLGSLVRDQLDGLQHNLAYARHGLPTDPALAGENAMVVAAVLRQSGMPCTYNFDNSEAMYYLSGVPSCSSVLAPVYAVPAEQPPILASLQAAAPEMVLFSSQHWWNAIDGKSLQQRTPELYAWAERNYPNKRVIGAYELRARTPFAPP